MGKLVEYAEEFASKIGRPLDSYDTVFALRVYIARKSKEIVRQERRRKIMRQIAEIERANIVK